MKSYTTASFDAKSKRSGHFPLAFYWAEVKWKTEGWLEYMSVETSPGTVYGMLTYIWQCGSKIREINNTSSATSKVRFFFFRNR